AAADQVSSDPIAAGFREVGADAVPMPSIPEMGSVWSFWGVTEAGIISGSLEPEAAWNKMVEDIQGAIDASDSWPDRRARGRVTPSRPRATGSLLPRPVVSHRRDENRRERHELDRGPGEEGPAPHRLALP